MLKSNKISVIQLILISISAIVSLKSLPLFAEVGLSIVFFLFVATICFFIPISMVIAELSSTWPSSGGCYLWIKKAYGESLAFFVMWAYWMESIIWFPTMLIFIVSMLAHSLSPFFPGIENSVYFLVFGIIFIFWLLTFINFYGVTVSVVFSSFGVLFGTIFPVFLIIFFGFYWFFSSEELNIVFSAKNLFPSLNFNSFVIFSGVLLGISGIELISFYVGDISGSKSSIYKVILLSSVFVLLIYVFGSLSIAIVIPKSEICLASGVIHALKFFFLKLNISFIVPFVAFLLLLGSLSGMNTWIVGPAKGLFVAASDGFLPKFLQNINSKNVPVNLLILQAFIGSILSVFFFLYSNSVNGLIWLFICLSFQFASLLYIVIFFTIIKLRKKYPNIYRPFKVPFLFFFSTIGILMCLFTFIISFFQPAEINVSDKSFYSFVLILSFFILILPSFFLIYFKSKKK